MKAIAIKLAKEAARDALQALLKTGKPILNETARERITHYREKLKTKEAP